MDVDLSFKTHILNFKEELLGTHDILEKNRERIPSEVYSKLVDSIDIDNIWILYHLFFK